MPDARILLADDEATVAADLREILTSLGYEIAGVATAADAAVEMAAVEIPDLVLMDIRMPGTMDGVEAAERIMDRLGIPVVYLTGHADEETMARALGVAPYGYVLKPFRIREMRGAIEVALKRHRTEAILRGRERRQRQIAEDLRNATAEMEIFTYSVVHDVRAPLRTMQGFAHTLAGQHGDSLDPEARLCVERIIEAGREMDGLLTDLLDFGRAGAQEIELGPCSLDDVLAAARTLVHADVEHRGATLRIAEGLPPVIGSWPLLVQVFGNLLGNALKFVPPGRTPEVQVAGALREGRVHVTVDDNGIGIPAGERTSIFRLFARGSRAEPFPGSGVGLAVVRLAVERQGGRVQAGDAPGGGARFQVDLPPLETAEA